MSVVQASPPARVAVVMHDSARLPGSSIAVLPRMGNIQNKDSAITKKRVPPQYKNQFSILRVWNGKNVHVGFPKERSFLKHRNAL